MAKEESHDQKRAHYRQMLRACLKNRIGLGYVLNDVWYYASSENMRHVKEELKKEFIMPIKTNRKVALSPEDKKGGHSEQASRPSRTRTEHHEAGFYLEQVPFALLLCKKQVFKNEDGAARGVFCIWLVARSDTRLRWALTTIYQRRWKVEEYHKSLKSNASLEKSPTKKVRTTQTNHVFSSIYAFSSSWSG